MVTEAERKKLHSTFKSESGFGIFVDLDKLLLVMILHVRSP
jgi:hypothetical protein